MLYSHDQRYKHIIHNHNDYTIKTSNTVLLEKYTSHFIWKGCVWEGVRDWTELQHIDPYGHQHFFPILLGCSTRGLGPSLSGCWFSLLHLISNWSGLQTDWSGAWGLPLLGAGFLYCIMSPTSLVSKLTDFLSSPSYIIVQRPPSSCGHHKLHSFNPSMVKATLCYSSTTCTCYLLIYIGAFPILTARLSRRSVYNTDTKIFSELYTIKIDIKYYLL